LGFCCISFCWIPSHFPTKKGILLVIFTTVVCFVFYSCIGVLSQARAAFVLLSCLLLLDLFVLIPVIGMCISFLPIVLFIFGWEATSNIQQTSILCSDQH